MATIRMSEAELAQNLPGALARVRQGDEVVIERDERALAVLRGVPERGRSLDDCIALADTLDTPATLDEGFMDDVEAGIAERSGPWNPPEWD
ncbi:MAG: hypothetical protein KDC27_17490 [Acidobacteria bacterium]|nr:hypothetical protein [Acidobacteriota bacterium]